MLLYIMTLIFLVTYYICVDRIFNSVLCKYSGAIFGIVFWLVLAIVFTPILILLIQPLTEYWKDIVWLVLMLLFYYNPIGLIEKVYKLFIKKKEK